MECLERGVASDQHSGFEVALRGQHAVEGITVFNWVAASLKRMQVGYWRVFKSIQFDKFIEAWHDRGRNFKLAEAMLRGDFPRARRAGQNEVSLVANQFPGVGRELRIIRPPPEQGVGVQQISHRASHA